MVPFGEYLAAQPEDSKIRLVVREPAHYFDELLPLIGASNITQVSLLYFFSVMDVYRATCGADSMAEVSKRLKQEMSPFVTCVASALLQSNAPITSRLAGEIMEIQIRANRDLGANIEAYNRQRKRAKEWIKTERILTVHQQIREGHTKKEAYRIVGELFNKSPDTIRREYERDQKRPTKLTAPQREKK